MKRILCFLMLILSLLITGCSLPEIEPNYSESDLEYLVQEKNIKKFQKTPESYYDFVKLVQNFSTDISNALYEKYQTKYDRMTVSPLSIYMALAMATSVAETEAQNELVNLLGIPYSDIVEYTKYLFSSLNNTLKQNLKTVYTLQLSNSIWLNENLKFKQNGLNILSNDFSVDTYQVPFSSNNSVANKAIKDYVYRNTKGLIDAEYNFDIYTLFLLINTLYLKDSWNSVGDDLLLTNEVYNFKNQNNTTKSINLLKGYYVPGKVQSGDGFEYFYTQTTRGLKLYFIKPTTKSLDEVYNNQNLNLILNDKTYNYVNSDLNEFYYTRCFFPEFDAKFDEDLTEILMEKYNVQKIFNSDYCNFDKLTDDISYVSSMIHQTKLVVDKKGIEGAAVTILGANGSAAAPNNDIYYDFVIDESFGFILTKDDVVLFSGVVNNL